MPTVQEHYDALLAEHYTWMFGVPFADKVKEQAGLLADMGVGAPGSAIDLGCGSGFQSFALVRLGAKSVLAIDTSRHLLDELLGHRRNEPIRAECADLINFSTLADGPVDTIVCMGDTLTHLPNRVTVSQLFKDIGHALKRGGQLVLSYRDLSTMPTGLDRFIPLRSTEDKIMTCFMERIGQTVMVHDLVYVRENDDWVLHKGAYPKLILPEREIKAELARRGFSVQAERNVRGMVSLALQRV